MTDMPPPYPGINASYQGYASRGNQQQESLGQHSSWTLVQQNGGSTWFNPNYNNQPTSQTGVYPNYEKPDKYV